MKALFSVGFFIILMSLIFSSSIGLAATPEPIRVGRIDCFTGFLEYMAKETQRGFELGIQYATNGTNKINGRPIEIIKEDSQLNPQIARQKALKLIDQDKVHFLVGAVSLNCIDVGTPASGGERESTAHSYRCNSN